MTKFEPDEIMSLEEARTRVLNGACSARHLRNEHKAGRLTLLKVGKGYSVTPAMLKEWLQTCVRKRSPRVSTSTQVNVSGSSEIDPTQSALDALNVTLSKQKKPSRNTSRSNTPLPQKPRGRPGS